MPPVHMDKDGPCCSGGNGANGFSFHFVESGGEDVGYAGA